MRSGCFYVGERPYPMYVEYREPPDTGRIPMVLVHGGAHTGACYVSTPDGRPGWATYFAERGRPSYVVDWPGHGRSPMPPDFAAMSTACVVDALGVLLERLGRAVLLTHSMSGPIGWQVAERWPDRVAAVVGVAPGPPANLQVPYPASAAVPPDHPAAQSIFGAPWYTPEDAPLRFGEDSARKNWANTARFPMDAFEAYLSSLVPESARAVNERNNVEGMGLAVHDFEVLKRLPLLVLTGDQDTRHPRAADEAVANAVGAEYLWLADEGYTGYGHMLMIEHGNEAIAERILRWLELKSL